MTQSEQLLVNMLERKRNIDNHVYDHGGVGYAGGEGQFTLRQRWLGDAVQLLLELELQRQGVEP
jgi:hypothetical protein